MARMSAPPDQRRNRWIWLAIFKEAMPLLGHRRQKLRRLHLASRNRFIHFCQIVQDRRRTEFIDLGERRVWKFQSFGGNEVDRCRRFTQLDCSYGGNPYGRQKSQLEHRWIEPAAAFFD